MIDSQMDDMIKEKLALKEQVNSLEQNLCKQIKEKECLLQTFIVFKSESKEKKDKYMENEIYLEKRIKKLDNILFKVGQSAQIVHMLKKPQAFYDNIHKRALGYQNPFHLKKGQRIKPTLFDNVVKIKTTPDARTEGEWGFKHTKVVFNIEIIPFLKSLKDIFNVFDKDLLNEIMEVQTVFNQMDAAIQQSLVDKQCLEIAKKELLLENDRLLQQIMSQYVLLTVMNFMSLIGESMNMDKKRNEPCDKWGIDIFNQMDAAVQQSSVDKQCLEIAKKELLLENDRLLQQIMSQDVDEIYNDLKAQLQDKDTTICKLKDIIKSMREKSKDENVNYDYREIGIKNVELENRVAKLLLENERLCNEINHVKQVFKAQFDSIKKTRVRTKEQSDSLIDKLNLKSAENEDLKAQIQDKVFVITSLKNDLRKVKGKEIIDIDAQTPSAFTIVPGMFKLDLEPLAPRFTSTNVVPPKQTTSHSDDIQKPELKIYSKKPKNVKNIDIPSSSSLVMTGTLLNSERPRLQGILGIGYYQLGNFIILGDVLYVEGLGHNLFSVDQFCDVDLEVAFLKNTCFIRNLEGVDLLLGSRNTNLYTISVDDMLKSSLICLLSKAQKTKS
ncbi:hypothetical protein Tco_0898386 [Tanacetum coccineum]